MAKSPQRSTGYAVPWLLSAPALLIIVVAAAAPLIVVIVYSFLSPGPYGGVVWQLSFEGWIKVLFDRGLFDDTLSLATSNLLIFARSLGLSLITTLVCLLVGVPTAYFIATRERRQRDTWLLLVTIPFWTNLVIRTFAIQDIIRKEGILNTLLLRLHVIDQPLQMLYTDGAVLLGMVYVYLPFMILPAYTALEKLDIRLLEAASDLYAKPAHVFLKVILPLTRPGIVAGATLVFIPAISAYVTPILLGGGKQLMMGDFIQRLFGQAKDWPYGSAISICLMGLVLAALLVNASSGKMRRRRHG